MSDRANIVYLYDGSFDGLMCCVFESYVKKEIPMNILPEEAVNGENGQGFFYDKKLIETNEENAARVYASIKRMGNDVERFVQTAFLFGYNEKAEAIFHFIRFAYKVGPSCVNMLHAEPAARVHAMVRAVGNEKHLFLEFLRFSEYSGGLVGVIEPKHMVLPLMTGHFSARFPEERFLIYDKSHGLALLYQPYESRIISVEDIEMPDAQEDEENYRMLWQGYFNAVAIKERINPRCQMGHMPKRFWKNMIETQPMKPAKRISGESIKTDLYIP